MAIKHGSNGNPAENPSAIVGVEHTAKKQSIFKTASIPIPEIEPVNIDIRYFNHPVTATIYPMKPTGYNPCVCCEACWCRGRSLINGSIAVATLELVVGIFGLIVAIIRFHMQSDYPPDEMPAFLLYKTRNLYGQQTLMFDAVPQSNQRSKQDRVFKNSEIKHFGLSENERFQAEDIMTWYVGTTAFVCLLSSIILMVSAASRNRGLANTSLLLHLLMSIASWIYVILMILYVILITAGEGPHDGKITLAGPFLLDAFIIAVLSFLLIFGTLCSNGLFHTFGETFVPPTPPIMPGKLGSVGPLNSPRASMTAV
ncbi:unnamed protein product [Allacma fusca]|uniref:Uncharacterized protein n=1 Tax=Allacma fusca TaxID=39272 RepID=A0A8J2LJI1_9HEXA|nr:unnamed protein product [Allacma fusca]